MASGGEDGSVKLWDLRKLAAFQTLGAPAEGAAGAPTAAVSALCFDASGSYLAGGYGDGAVGVWASKDWAQLAVLREHAARVTGVAWGPHARTLYSSSLDRAVKVYGGK